MAKAAAFSSALCLLLLLFPIASLAEHQRKGSREQCKCDQLEAHEPTRRVESEAGVSEFWDHNNEQFRCVGVSAVRHTIEPRGLLLPSSSNSPRLVYVLQGDGIGGLVIPGCHESFSSFQESSHRQIQGRRFGEQERSQQEDQHQKVHHLKQGDTVAVPPGVPVWGYNNGDRPLIVVVFHDTGNYINQLDNTPRRFFLGGGNLQQSGQKQTGSESRRRGGSSYGSEEECGNIFSGFDVELLSEALGINEETARKLQGREASQKGFIVRVEEGLHAIRPRTSISEEEHEWQEERSERTRRGSSSSEWEHERRRRGSSNGIEETLCNLKFKLNIGNPIHSDVYSREAGQITTLNSQKLSILNYLQIGAEKGRLRTHALIGPKWTVNAHSVVYVIRGNGRVQIVDSNGNSAMDERVREGQMIVVPQNFVTLVRAEEDGLEYFAFKTNGNAVTNHVAGKGSTLRGLPVEVLANSFQISREEALRLKEGRSQELAVFVPQKQFSTELISAIEMVV